MPAPTSTATSTSTPTPTSAPSPTADPEFELELKGLSKTRFAGDVDVDRAITLFRAALRSRRREHARARRIRDAIRRQLLAARREQCGVAILRGAVARKTAAVERVERVRRALQQERRDRDEAQHEDARSHPRIVMRLVTKRSPQRPRPRAAQWARSRVCSSRPRARACGIRA